jgi:hypothetical protein
MLECKVEITVVRHGYEVLEIRRRNGVEDTETLLLARI